MRELKDEFDELKSKGAGATVGGVQEGKSQH
jgi:hypothetical protein